ncbi:MAG TPA: alanine racemase [Thermodesulfobacteriota bacterium]|nr:alanine racemase [Thermodesulfobacteriota bacterium]
MGTRPTAAIISVAALKHNYGEVKNLLMPGTKTMAVVKANAYGHGDLYVAKTLEDAGCEMFGVAFVEEGARLRQGGIKRPIVVLGGIYPSQIQDCFEFDLTPVIFDSDTATLLDTFAKKHNKKKAVHVKIDSGMGRLGILPRQIVGFFQELKTFGNLAVEGMLSHLSEAEAADKQFSKKQLDTFLKTISIAQGLGCDPPYIHMANSAAILDLPDARFSLVRPGLMLYGAYTSLRLKDKARLKPVMKLKTQIIQVKKMSAGTPISYSRTFMTQKESLIATLPIGYGDGLPFALSGKGEVLVRGARAPIAGRVCMDFTMIDVTDIRGVATGDEAILIGTQGEETISVEEVATKADTIPYEVFCNISARVPRLPA